MCFSRFSSRKNKRWQWEVLHCSITHASEILFLLFAFVWHVDRATKDAPFDWSMLFLRWSLTKEFIRKFNKRNLSEPRGKFVLGEESFDAWAFTGQEKNRSNGVCSPCPFASAFPTSNHFFQRLVKSLEESFCGCSSPIVWTHLSLWHTAKLSCEHFQIVPMARYNHRPKTKFSALLRWRTKEFVGFCIVSMRLFCPVVHLTRERRRFSLATLSVSCAVRHSTNLLFVDRRNDWTNLLSPKIVGAGQPEVQRRNSMDSNNPIDCRTTKLARSNGNNQRSSLVNRSMAASTTRPFSYDNNLIGFRAFPLEFIRVNRRKTNRIPSMHWLGLTFDKQFDFNSKKKRTCSLIDTFESSSSTNETIQRFVQTFCLASLSLSLSLSLSYREFALHRTTEICYTWHTKLHLTLLVKIRTSSFDSFELERQENDTNHLLNTLRTHKKRNRPTDRFSCEALLSDERSFSIWFDAFHLNKIIPVFLLVHKVKI